MFVADLKKSLSHIIQTKSIPTQIGLNGFAMIQLCELGASVSENVSKNTWDFIAAVDELAGEFNAQFVGIAFNCILLRGINNAAADSAESPKESRSEHRPITDCSPIVSVSGSAIKEIDYLSLKLAAKEAFLHGDCLESLNRIGFAYVSKKDVSHDIMDPALVNDKTPELSYLKSLFYRAAKDAAHELGYEVIGDTITDIILQAVPEFVPVTAVVSDDCNQTGESSCGNMRSSDPLECCASDINHDKKITIVNDGDNNWSVTGQPEGSVTWGIDPLYALAGFLNRSDVTRFMDRSGTNETAMLQLNYREPKRLPAKGECIWVFKPKRNTGPRQNSYTRDTDGIPLLTLSLNGREWCASDILVVQPSPHDKPRYFTRIYPEIREGDTVFAEVYPGSFRIAAMHNGVLSFSSASFTATSPDEVVSIGVLKDPLVLGVEIDKQDFESIISERVFSGHSK